MHNRIFEFTSTKRRTEERYDARKNLPASFLTSVNGTSITPENERTEAIEWLDDQIMNYCTSSDCDDETFVFSKNNAKIFVVNIYNKYTRTLQKMLTMSMDEFAADKNIIEVPSESSSKTDRKSIETATLALNAFANGNDHGTYIIFEDELMTLNKFMKKLYTEMPENDVKRFYIGSIYEYHY